MCNRGKLIEVHRDWKKTLNSDVCWVLIHRDSYELIISDVFCFGNFWRYIGMVLIWPIPMYVFIGF